MARGCLALVLHAHLPFVRHPEYEDFLEEDWLYEAITETYVPLLRAFLRLREDRVRFRVAMSVSAPLAAMLSDGFLRGRYDRHLALLTDLAEREAAGHAAGSALGVLGRHYLRRFRETRAFIDGFRGDLLAPLRMLADEGSVEILACTATHGFLPLMSGAAARRAQVRAGAAEHEHRFGRRPRGMWLSECGYDHGIDRVLAAEKIEFFFLDTHGVEHGRPRPAHGTHAAVRTPAGPAAFARDTETGRQVWSATEGYPGDPVYREFYRDVGWDAAYEYIRPYLHADGVRRGVGLKYHRVTGRVPLHQKALYDPAPAEERAREHARNFVFNRKHQIAHLASQMKRPPIVVAPFDAELFGHWWYEGPLFVEEVLRAASREPDIETVTPSEYLDRHGAAGTIRPNPSTWGDGGTNRAWLCGDNAWLYRYQHWAEEEMTELVRRFGRAPGLPARALRQAGRELLLMQSSDWAFILSNRTAAPYAARRFKRHLAGFETLRAGLLSDALHEPTVAAHEAWTPIFAGLDVGAWG